MNNRIIFFANTLWFLKKFKYELIRDISKNNEVTCIYLRKGPPFDKLKIDQLIKKNSVQFQSFRNFLFNSIYYKFNSLLNFKIKSFNYQKIIIFTIGPILISSLLPQKHKANTFYVLEGLGRIFSSDKFLNNFIRIFTIRIYKFLFKRCKLVFVLNSFDYLYLIENRICSIEKIKVLPGTGLNYIQVEKQIDKKIKKAKYIDYIGRLIVEKGFYKFILTKLNFQKNYPELDKLYNFRIISPQEDINNLSNDEKKFLKKHNIEIRPYLEEPYSYYLESKALIVPSSYGEGLSRVVLEASYIGIPILATKIRGIEEILTNKYKYFIKSTNPFSMSQQLAEMIKDNNYFQKIREKQKTYIKNNFSINKSSNIFIENLFKK